MATGQIDAMAVARCKIKSEYGNTVNDARALRAKDRGLRALEIGRGMLMVNFCTVQIKLVQISGST